MNNKNLISIIASYGNRYSEEYLNQNNPDAIESDWWTALDFFLVHACYQGRRDDISHRVYGAVKSVLSPYFSVEDKAAKFNKLKQQNWEPLRKELNDRIGKGKVGKARDVTMVISALEFICRLPELNLVNHSVNQIRLGKLEAHYEELQRSRSVNGIIQVGPKIAAFYLRDVVSLFQLEDDVSPSFAFYLQPIDVWVRRLTQRLGVVDKNTNDEVLKAAIVDLCNQNDISPLSFNQGAWYIGSHSFEIVLEILANQS